MFIKNLPIGLKLTLISLMPMLLALSFIGHDISASFQAYKSMSRGEALNTLTLKAGHLVHELQRERGLSSGFLGGNSSFSTALQRQQSNTDQQRQAFLTELGRFDSTAYGQKLATSLQQISYQLAQLTGLRQSVMQQNISSGEAVAAYSKLNQQLLDITTQYSLLTEDLSVSHAATAYYFFSMTKEQAGKERAILNEVFSRDRFSPVTYRKFLSVLTKEQMYSSQFASHATQQHKAEVDRLLHGEATQNVQAMRDAALSRNEGFKISPQQWFSAASDRINQLKQAEDYLAEELALEVAQHKQESFSQLITLASIAFISSVLILAISLLIQRNILRQTRELSRAIYAVEVDSNLTIEAPVYSNDELGQLACHFNKMISHLRSLTRSVTDVGGKLQEMVSQVQGVAVGVNHEVGKGLDQTNMIASSLEQMGLSVSEVAGNCSIAADRSDQANVAASEGAGMVSKAHQNMSELSDQIDTAVAVIDQVAADSDEIGSVLDVITGIAEQTNLLALNAAIEAARAGDQGRGFAVVADEVRGLAHKTQESSARVQSMIEQLQTRSREAVRAMQDSHARTGSTVDGFSLVLSQLENITEQSSSVNQMNLQNAAATEQQSATVDEINHNIQDVQSSYNETSERVSTLNQSARRLEDLSRMLSDEVRQFKV